MKRLFALGMLVAGCGGDPVDAEGTWTVSGTNRTNDCQIPNWNVGDSFTNVSVVITQNSEAVIADVQGGGGFYLDLLLGADAVFSGSADGDELDLTREGTRSDTTGNCTFTYNAQFLVTVTGDLFAGRLNYRTAHNNNSDCAAITCLSYQDVNGTRPPQ